MRRMYISSLHRLRKEEGYGRGELGRIYVYDWDEQRLLNDPYGFDPGPSLNYPEGRSHGARGLTVHNGLLYVAGSGDKISKYDMDTFELVETLRFSEFKYLHQIKDRDGLLYVASTANDRRFILKNDVVVDVLDLSKFKGMLDKSPFLNKSWGAGRLHFNSLGWDDNGDEYHVYFTPGVIFNASKEVPVFFDPAVSSSERVLHCPHDVLFHKGRAIVNSSTLRKTIRFDIDISHHDVIFTDSSKMPEDFNAEDAERNRFGATRMLAAHDNTLFVGSVPMHIHELRYVPETDSYEHVHTVDLTTVFYEAIFDMVLDPRDW